MKKQLSLSFGLILAGCLCYWACHHFDASLPVEADGFLAILALVSFAWGGATLLWAVEKSLRGIGSSLMILIGCFIMVLSAVAGAVLFALLGGFMAVIGTLFFLRKRTC